MTNKHEKAVTCKRSACPIACVLDIIGDKWTLLVVRDLFAGKSMYGEFQNSPEKIPTNILADRLKRLLRHGIIIKTAYQEKPIRYKYEITEKGYELGSILKGMVAWGEKYISGSKAQIVGNQK